MATPASVTASFEELDPAVLSTLNAKATNTPTEKTEPVVEKTATEGKAGTPAASEGAEKTESTEGAKTPQFASEEAVATLEKLEGLGITPDKAESLVTRASAFDNVVTMLQNDPAAFFGQIRQTDPKMFMNLLEKATDLYLEIKPPSSSEGGTSGAAATAQGGNQAANPLLDELKALRARLDERDERDNKTATTQRLATVKADYEGKVSAMLTKAAITGRDAKAVRAMVNQAVSEDPKAVEEINRGQFTSLAKHVQTVLNDWTADTTTAAKESAAKRDEVVTKGTREIATSAGQPGGETARKSRDSDWDDVSTELAAALNKNRK